MGMKITQRMPSGEGIAAGSTATFRIPVGQRFHALYFKFNYNATTQNLAHFTEIRLFVNGQVFQRFSATERNNLNIFDLAPSAISNGGILIIPFDRVGLLQSEQSELTSINTGVADSSGRLINSLYMEVDIAAGATVAPADLALYAKISDVVAGGAGLIPYIRKEPRTIAGADADFQLSDLVNPGVNAPDKVALSRVTFIPNTSTLSNLRIDRNQYIIFDRPDGLNRQVQDAGIRAPVAGYYTIDTGENGIGTDVVQLLGMTDYRYRLNVAGAMTVTVLSEYFGVLSAN
jgi:hypothetical protein